MNDNPWWSDYFTRIYGSVPSSGFPICTGAFQFLWKLSAVAAGVVDDATVPTDCTADDPAGMELNAGDYYIGNAFLDALDFYAFIYNPNLYGVEVPPNTWVEVIHTGFAGDVGDSIWYYMAVGSGVWINVGNTASYSDHTDWVADMLGKDCDDNTAEDLFGPPATECEFNFQEGFDMAISLGYNTIQFTTHHDCTCGPGSQADSSYHFYRHCPTEIVALGAGSGTAGCPSASIFRSGWGATGDCACAEGGDFISAVKDPLAPPEGCPFANCGVY